MISGPVPAAQLVEEDSPRLQKDVSLREEAGGAGAGAACEGSQSAFKGTWDSMYRGFLRSHLCIVLYVLA